MGCLLQVRSPWATCGINKRSKVWVLMLDCAVNMFATNTNAMCCLIGCWKATEILYISLWNNSSLLTLIAPGM